MTYAINNTPYTLGLGVSKRSRIIIVGCGEDRFLYLEVLLKITKFAPSLQRAWYRVSDGDETMLSALDPTAAWEITMV